MRIHSGYTALSSEVYPLSAHDLLGRIKKHEPGKRAARTVTLQLGEAGVREDEVACGGALVRTAAAWEGATVPVRVAFRGYRPGILRWGWHLIHPLRKRSTRMGSGVYHIDPNELRRRGLEILVRHEANAYCAISRTLLPAGQERAHWNRLKESIRTEGFKDEYPIVILVRRTAGLRDRLLQGHHRLAIALELGLRRVPVSFAYAGHAPWFLTAPYDRLRTPTRYLGQ